MDVDHDGRIDVFGYEDYLSYGFLSMDRNGNSVLDLDEFSAHTRTPRTRPLLLTRHHDKRIPSAARTPIATAISAGSSSPRRAIN